MKTPENNDHLQQELRGAQLEIKALREQLLKATQAAQPPHDNGEKLPERLPPEPPGKPASISLTAVAAIGNGAPNNGTSNGATSAKWRVLCVEDSEANFRLIESILADRPKTDLTWAETGEKALEMANAQAPHVILLDLDLPDMHGSKLLERLQSQPLTAQTPVIVISADATPSQIERMLAAGARNYLTKPFEIRRFLFMLDEVLPAA